MEWGCLWTHSASGTATQGKQCSGSHLVETGEKGAEEGSWGGVVGGGEGIRNEHKHMEKQIFPLPAAVDEGKCQHAPCPRLTVLHSAPPPGTPCSATECGQQCHCGAFPQGGETQRSASTRPHARTDSNTSCTPCSFSHKRDACNFSSLPSADRTQEKQSKRRRSRRVSAALKASA